MTDLTKSLFITGHNPLLAGNLTIVGVCAYLDIQPVWGGQVSGYRVQVSGCRVQKNNSPMMVKLFLHPDT